MNKFTFFFIFYFLGTPLAAQENGPAALAHKASQMLDTAHAALANSESARDRVAALSQTIRAYEDGLIALREGLRRASLRESAIRQEFDARREEISRLLGVLVNIQSNSGPLVTLHPEGPLDTVRSGMLVADLTPHLQAEAVKLRQRLEEVALLRALQEGAADRLEQALRGVQDARTRLSMAIANREELPQRFLSDPEKLQSLIDSAETLDGFATALAEIEISDLVEDPIRDFKSAKGSLTLPASGTLLRRYQERDAAGIARDGMILATRPLALVTTPWPVTLRYAGPLLDHKNVVIIEPQAGILLVLAGLDQVFGEVGQVIPVNTAIGMMGNNAPVAATNVENVTIGAGSDNTETLYIELRLDGTPVDPAPWFTGTKD